MADLYYCIATYNEEETLPKCLHSLAEQGTDTDLETLICLNGCTDNTETVAFEAVGKYPGLNIKVTHSEKGLVYAQKSMIEQIDNRKAPLLFVDADVSLHRGCVRIMKEELEGLDSLLVVGGWPIPSKPNNMNLWETFLYYTLHARALLPESEISVNDVSKFKQYTDEKPQPTVSAEFEKKSKIYFHGRIFMLRNADIFEMPEDKNLADDTFLPNMIHYKYGPGVIRTRFDAVGNYNPYLSLKSHFKTYRRIFLQKRYLDTTNPQFSEVREFEKSRLNWPFILSEGVSVTARFAAYAFIRNIEEISYRLLPKPEPSRLWEYDKK